MSTGAADSYSASHVEPAAAARYQQHIGSGFPRLLWDRTEAQLLVHTVDRHVPEPADALLLDLACGAGRASGLFARSIGRRVGVDISAAHLGLGVGQIGLPVIASATSLPLADAAADVVVALRFLSNAEDELRRGALAEVCRVLRPGGVAVVNVHNVPRTLPNLGRQLMRLMRGRNDPRWVSLLSLRRMFAESGLTTVDVISYGIVGAAQRASWRGRLIRLLCGQELFVLARTQHHAG
jgi:SAM-dependent methyltransferase